MTEDARAEIRRIARALMDPENDVDVLWITDHETLFEALSVLYEKCGGKNLPEEVDKELAESLEKAARESGLIT